MRLRDDRRLVLKHLPPDGDWLTRRTAGHGRTRLLWDSGTLSEVGAALDHTVVAVMTLDDGEVVVMRDAAELLLTPGSTVSLPTARRLLAGLAALHRAFEGCKLSGLCDISHRYELFAPAWHATDTGPAPHPSRAFIASGWEAFAELVPGDLCDAVFSLHAEPRALGEALLRWTTPTLLHGDPKLENLGLDGDRLVAIDWGDLTGVGPAEVDVAWFAIQDGWRFDVMPDDIFNAYDEVAGRRRDEHAFDLACIGALTQFGFKLAGRSRSNDEAVSARSRELLTWWLSRVQDALSAWFQT